MIETLVPAVCAILQAIVAYTVPLNMNEIDRVVFYSVADDHLLLKMLREMKSDGLISEESGRYTITDRGRKYIEQNCG